jgi:hypothetical protein
MRNLTTLKRSLLLYMLVSSAHQHAMAGTQSLPRTFAVCLQQAMSTYPNVNPLDDYWHSMHYRPTMFGTYLNTCMRANGFDETLDDYRCVQPENGVENEAYCYRPATE